MRGRRILSLVVAVGLSLASCGLARAGFEDGIIAYESGDYAAALEAWRPLAEQGDARAQFNLGVMHARGEGVPMDAAAALDWYRRAAEQGYAAAQTNLGIRYETGAGVPQDHRQAAAWYARAAAQGNPAAQNNLGVLYAAGQGVAKDERTAVDWMSKAAVQGYAEAQRNLAVMFYEGRGVPKDLARAYVWWTRAGATRNRDAVAAQLNAAQRAQAEALLAVPLTPPSESSPMAGRAPAAAAEEQAGVLALLQGTWGADCASPEARYDATTYHALRDHSARSVERTIRKGDLLEVHYRMKSKTREYMVVDTFKVGPGDTLRLISSVQDGQAMQWSKAAWRRCS